MRTFLIIMERRNAHEIMNKYDVVRLLVKRRKLNFLADHNRK